MDFKCQAKPKLNRKNRFVSCWFILVHICNRKFEIHQPALIKHLDTHSPLHPHHTPVWFSPGSTMCQVVWIIFVFKKLLISSFVNQLSSGSVSSQCRNQGCGDVRWLASWLTWMRDGQVSQVFFNHQFHHTHHISPIFRMVYTYHRNVKIFLF